MRRPIENSEFEDYADGMFPSPMLFSGIPHIVPPPLMPHNLFPDPTKKLLNQFDSFKDIPKSAHSKEFGSRECNPGNPKYEIADIFRLYWEDYQAVNPVTERHYKVVYDILNCRTGNFGYSISACDTCAHTKIFPNSCRNSHCPKCQGNKRMQWVDARLEDLLPVPYYHSVFTLPNKIFPLCLYNQRIVYDLLFQSAADTLMQFGADPKWLGGKAGFFMVLHTWGQQLPVHPHVHCIIPAGAYNEATCEWIHPQYEKNDFLFPVRALSKVFRGKFIHGLKKAYHNDKLKFPGDLELLQNEGRFEAWLNDIVSTDWIVYSKAPFGGPEDVVRYVGRYTHRVAISGSRIISIDNGIIRFTFKNYKKMKVIENYADIWEETELPASEFIRRFLYHVLPLNYHRIRYYGFLSNSSKALFREIWEYLIFEEEARLFNIETEPYMGIPCPNCENGVLVPIVIVDGSGNILKGSFSELSAFRQETRKNFEIKQEPPDDVDKSKLPELFEAWDTS